MITNITGNFKIRAISSAIPKNELNYLDDIKNFNFPEKKSLKLKKIMGYDKHRMALEGVTSRYLCEESLKDIFDNTNIKADSIDAIISVTQSPDHFIPYNTGIIQKNLGLKEDILTIDITQGCAGYVVGLMQSFMTLKLSGIKRVALVVGDVLSSKVSKKDRNSFPLVGDAGSATIIDIDDINQEIEQNITYYYKSMGEKAFALQIPAGGFKIPITEETSKEFVDDDNNIRSKNHLVMNGASVFAFTQDYVSKMITEILEHVNVNINNIDYFLMHQPNKFILSKIADDLNINYNKVPMNIVEKYGNPSSASIPLLICENHDILKKDNKILFSGFGAGLTLASIYIELNKVEYINLIER